MRKTLASAALIILWRASAIAQTANSDLGSLGVPSAQSITSLLTEQLMNDSSFRQALTENGRSEGAPTTFQRTGSLSPAPARLAEQFPAAQRHKAEGIFKAILDAYPKVESTYGLTHNDLAGSLGVFLVGSYEAATEVHVEDPAIRAVIIQARRALANSAIIARSSNGARQEMYDETAALGLFMIAAHEYLQKSPNPQFKANLRQVGARYLKGFVGVEPDHVSIGNSGIKAVRPTTIDWNKMLTESTEKIETIGFQNGYKLGAGGRILIAPRPVVLFRSGDALTNIAGLKFDAGLEAYKSVHPDEWAKWRRSGNSIEINTGKGWEKLPFPDTMTRLPHGFKLAGKYSATAAAGSNRLHQSTSVIAIANITFQPDGSFAVSSRSSSSSRGETPDRITTAGESGEAATQQGKYVVDGYIMTLTYANGSTERVIFMAKANDPKVIWFEDASLMKQ